jgi:HK97 family phage major capsid protein
MNELETKVTALKEGMEAAKNEAAAAKAAVAEMQQKLAEKDTELKTAKENIDALDGSAKELKGQIESLENKIKESVPQDWKAAFKAALEEKKETITNAIKAGAKNFTVELKSATAIGTGHISPNNVLGVDFDPSVIAAVPVANQFLAVFGVRPRRGNKIGWVEASSQNGADYVAELAQNNNRSDVSFVEKQRAFGKIATFMTISTEVEDWFQQIYDFCVNEGTRMINAKIDAELCAGAGDDSTYPNKVYGIKGQATSYSPMVSASIQDANIADVLADAAAKIAKAGYNANVAFLTFELERQLRGLKDANGNYLYDAARAMLGGLRIVPTSRLSSGEAIILDTNCVEVYGGNGYELEFQRDPVYDAYNVFFRKAVQVKVSTPAQAGIQYVAAMATSIAALDSGAGTLGDVVTKLGAIKDELTTIKTNTGNIKDYSTAVGAINTAITKLSAAVNESDQIETHPNTQA